MESVPKECLLKQTVRSDASVSQRYAALCGMKRCEGCFASIKYMGFLHCAILAEELNAHCFEGFIGIALDDKIFFSQFV
jgi:hypothetical protein